MKEATRNIQEPMLMKSEMLAAPLLLELLRDGGDLLHSVLVGGQVALKGLVFPEQRLDF